MTKHNNCTESRMSTGHKSKSVMTASFDPYYIDFLMVSSVSFAKFDSGGQTPAVSLMVILADRAYIEAADRQTLMDGTSAF